MIVPVMHRESLVHAMVEFTDGSVVAQMSTHDMRLAIAHALDWPERHPGLNQPLDFTKPLSLNFTPADYERYPLLKTAEEAMERGGTYPAVLNGANEAAVGLFLTGKISFLEIEKIVTEALANHVPVKKPKLENIVKVDREIKKTIYDQYLY